MSNNIVELNEEIIKGKSRSWFAAVWRRPSSRCIWQVYLYTVRKILLRLYAAAINSRSQNLMPNTVAELKAHTMLLPGLPELSEKS